MDRADWTPRAVAVPAHLLALLAVVAGFTASSAIRAEESLARGPVRSRTLGVAMDPGDPAGRDPRQLQRNHRVPGRRRDANVAHHASVRWNRSHERVQTLDGKPREFIRLRTENNDEVRCLIPESRRVIVEHRAIDDPFPGMIGAPAEAILEHYGLKAGGVERVAGIECRVVSLRAARRPSLRLSPVRRSHDRTAAESADVQCTAATDGTDCVHRHPHRRAYRPCTAQAGMADRRLDDRTQRVSSGGPRQSRMVGAEHRPDFAEPRKLARRVGTRDAMQVVFSDGLATLSVFIEPSAERRRSRRYCADDGADRGLLAAHRRRIVTVVGEVPPAAVRSVAEFRRVSARADGLGHRSRDSLQKGKQE